MSAHLGDAQIFRHRFIEPKGHDLIAGPHDLLRRSSARAQRLNHEFVNERVAGMRMAGVAEDILKFLGGNSVVAFARRAQAKPTQQAVSRRIEQPDKREKHVVEREERRRKPQCDFRSALNRHRLRPELTKDDVHKCDHGERDREGDGRHHVRIGNAPARKQWLQAMRKKRFTDPTETQTRQRHPQLRSREHRTQSFGRPQRKSHSPAAGLGHRLQLARAHLDQGKLRRHEKTVGQHEARNRQGSNRTAVNIIHGNGAKVRPQPRRANHLAGDAR